MSERERRLIVALRECVLRITEVTDYIDQHGAVTLGDLAVLKMARDKAEAALKVKP